MASITKNKQSMNTIKAMAERAFGKNVTIVSCEELPEGFCNAAYRISLSDGRETILKISPDAVVRLMSCETAMMRTETEAMCLAAKKDLVKTAEIWFYDDSRTICSGEYFFMEVLDGSSLYQEKEAMTAAEKQKMDFLVGRLLKRLHEEKGERFGHFCVSSLQYDTWYEAFSHMLFSVAADGESVSVDIGVPYGTVLERLADFPEYFAEVKEPAFIHFDSWEGNIFVKDGEITGVIDWERAMWADPLMEDRFRTHSVNDDFLKGYGLEKMTENQKIRCMWYDVYLYMIMMIEGEFRHYETKDQYNWVRGLFDRVWENLTKL